MNAVQVVEGCLEERGYLDRAIISKLGHDLLPWRRVLKNAELAADAVAAMYLDRCHSYGTLDKGDDRRLWVCKKLPDLVQGRKTRGVAFRLGNEARLLEDRKLGAGLQFIYDMTQKG
ncbi:MAG TPA: hypothetical protein VJG90_02370 [Candidatus Nanoarchaeia archaeon]|nr:hypothetical protein [Candidatus Nanoarchaeia archaeon]